MSPFIAVMTAAGNLGQLQSYVSELSTAAKIITDHYPDVNTTSKSHISIPNNAPSEVDRARRNLLAVTKRLQALLAKPADFIQQLASHVRNSCPKSWLANITTDSRNNRINCLLVCNGLENSKSSPISPSTAVCRSRTSQS